MFISFYPCPFCSKYRQVVRRENDRSGSGNYAFATKDYGFTFGNTEIHLNTTGSFVSQVCHRDNGRHVQKTLTIGGAAVAAHLTHGDTEGPCEQ